MRAAVVAAVVAGLLSAAGAARADVYRYRAPNGTLVFTNAPAVAAPKANLPPLPLIPFAPVLGLRPRAFPALFTDRNVPYDGLIREIADRYEVEYALVKAVIKAESGFDRLAVSRAGARGLMQLMPATAARHQVRNVFMPRDNIEGGVRHLRMLIERYGGNLPLVLAAYNAGEGRVEDAGGMPAIAETRQYVARVLRYRAGYMREIAGGLYSRR